MMLANPAYFRFARSTRLQPRLPFIWLTSFATVLIGVFERADSSVAGAVDSAAAIYRSRPPGPGPMLFPNGFCPWTHSIFLAQPG
jgi:hypothetical protein